jgi:hypothetical protein
MLAFIETLKYRNEPLFYFGLICFLFALLFLALTKIIDVEVAGANAWYKPFKFAFSTFLYAWAMAWYCSYLPNFNVKAFNWTVIVLLGFEIVYIAFQAGKGQLSHFNISTPIYTALYAAMGIAASLVTLYTAYIGVLFFQNEFPDLPPYYLWAIRIGIIIFVVFAFEGFVMGSRLAHTIGGADGGQGLPLVNWSTKYGDPRIAHFIGMHALQVLPVLAFYLLKDVKTTLFVGVLYAALAVFTLWQALQGRPFFKFVHSLRS